MFHFANIIFLQFYLFFFTVTNIFYHQIVNSSKFRVDLRFFADLVATAVFPEREGLTLLAGQLTLLVNGDKDEHNNLSIISSFCKHCGDDYAGLIPRKIVLLANKHQKELPTSQVKNFLILCLCNIKSS